MLFRSPLVNLNYLDLNHNSISNVRPLAHLTNLNYLDLSYNEISNIRYLGAIVSLVDLNLSHNLIEDVQYLSPLTSLSRINLDNNQFINLKGLSPLVDLTSLTLHHQERTLRPIRLGADDNSVSIDNPVFGIYGETIMPTSIYKGGSYDSITNKITWEKINEKSSPLSFTFETLVSIHAGRTSAFNAMDISDIPFAGIVHVTYTTVLSAVNVLIYAVASVESKNL